MYVHPAHRLDDRDALFALMAANPLGAWVCHGREGLIANPLPFLLVRHRGPLGTLVGHNPGCELLVDLLAPSSPEPTISTVAAASRAP